MHDVPLIVILIVLTALIFDFINGFHDSANSISTVVSTRVLSPKVAVLWAAFFNFAAILFIGTPVAKTIGTGIIHPDIIDDYIIIATLGGAITWNLITWYLGLPSSSSHALIGGLIGTGIVKAGTSTLIWSGIIKTAAFIFISPLLGLVLGLTFMSTVLTLCRNYSIARTQKLFRRMQLLSAAIFSLGHGMNDAQKRWGSSPWYSTVGDYWAPPFTSLMGRISLLPRHRLRNHDRWLEDREDHGNADHQIATHWRV